MVTRPVMANMAGTITLKRANVVVSRHIVKQLRIVERSNMVPTTRTYHDLQNYFSCTSFSMFRGYIVRLHNSRGLILKLNTIKSISILPIGWRRYCRLLAYLTDNPFYHERDRLLDQNLPAFASVRRPSGQSIALLYACRSCRSSLRSMWTHVRTYPTSSLRNILSEII